MNQNPNAVALRSGKKWEAFLQERRLAIGGSDAKHLLDIDPWGCQRRLWYEKAGVPEDFPFTGNRHTERGIELEELAVRAYEGQTLRTTRHHPWTRNRERPHMAVHLDRAIYDQGAYRTAGPGVLEVKCPTLDTYQSIKAQGCPPDYWLQAQWGMAVTGWAWSSVAVFHAEWMKCLVFDVERDADTIREFAPAADAFWATLQQSENPFAGVEDPKDRRCRTCPWRTVCRGLGATPTQLTEEEQLELRQVQFRQSAELDPIIERFLDARDRAKEAEKAYKAVKGELEKALGRENVEGQIARAYWTEYDRAGYTVKAGRVRTLKVIPLRADEAINE